VDSQSLVDGILSRHALGEIVSSLLGRPVLAEAVAVHDRTEK
jgi:hypothetical protein